MPSAAIVATAQVLVVSAIAVVDGVAMERWCGAGQWAFVVRWMRDTLLAPACRPLLERPQLSDQGCHIASLCGEFVGLVL